MTTKQKIQFGFIAILFLCIGFSFPIDSEKQSIDLPISVLDSKFDLCLKNSSFEKSCKDTLDFLEQALEIRNIQSNLNIKTRYEIARKKLNGFSSKEEIITNAFNVWLSAIDHHARVVLAQSEESQSKDSYLSVKGIGIKVRMFKNRALVAYTLEGSSAEEIGLLPGDEILAVNGENLLKMSQPKKEFTLKKAKSPFMILAQRGNRIFQASASEKKFKLENVSFRLDRSGPIGVASIRVRTFAKDSSCESISKAVRSLESQGATRIELDLRDNPGGFVHEAQCAAGLFLGSGHLFAQLNKIELKGMDSVPSSPIGTLSGEKHVALFTDQEKITNLPVQIRINQNTASAAEMFAAALQDEGRAKIMGTRSFGKGSMQSAYHPWDDPELLLFKTTHIIDRPNGKTLQYSGVTPDIFTEKAEGSSFPREIDLTQ